MHRFLVVWVTAALLGGGIAGHAGADPNPPPQGAHVTDSEGDAYEYNAHIVRSKISDACRAFQPATAEACRSVPVPGLPTEASDLGLVAAPPSLDVIGGWFEQTPEALRVSVQVAALDAALTGIALEETASGPRAGQLVMSWRGGQDGECTEYVWFNGVHAQYETYDVGCKVADPSKHPWETGCNAWWWCTYGVDVEVSVGEPGTVTWTVPRDLLHGGQQGDVLEEPVISSWLTDGRIDLLYKADAAGHPASPGGLVRGTSQYKVDDSEPGRSLTFETVMSEPDTGRVSPHVSDLPGQPEDPRLDMLAFDVIETPDQLGVEIQVAQLDQDPEGTSFWGALGLGDGHVIDLSTWSFDENTRTGHAVYGLPYNDEFLGGHTIVVPVTLEEELGSPGTIRLLMDRGHLPYIGAKDHTTLLVGGMWTEDTFHRLNTQDTTSPYLYAAARIEGASDAPGGEYVEMPRYFFQFDTPQALFDSMIQVRDVIGDAQPPDPLFDEGLLARFDITYLEARAINDDELHLTMGINDLSQAVVPRLYDGMFYAVALQKGDRTTMVGYHKEQGSASGSFLCAPDITVLTQTQRDPTEAVWTLINGVVSQPPGNGDGEGGPGAITFYAPESCFGGEMLDPSGDSISFDRMAAGTFLIQGGAGGLTQRDVSELDNAETDGPISLMIPQDPPEVVAATKWYQSPFGLDAFWDVLGLAFAVAVTVASIGYGLHRRRLDKAAIADAKGRENRDVYQTALQRAIAAEVDPATDTVLRALRNRLHISEREHAMLELEARTAAGVGIAGLSAGALFLGKYRVEGLLGEGGFARTYLARDEKLARDVVLKVARWGSPREMQRGLREARILAGVDHKNVVRIFDVEEVADHMVLVLEHVPGGSLADTLKKGPLPEEDAMRIMADCLAGLEVAHAAGIVHQDLKPANILIARDGSAKIADFGIARDTKSTGTVSKAGTLVGPGAGTVRYMAPEQARGETATTASDLYAAGVVLYEMLTGRSCIEVQGRSEFEIRTAIAKEAPALPIANVSSEANGFLRTLLSKDPAHRGDIKKARDAIGASTQPPMRPLIGARAVDRNRRRPVAPPA